MRFFTFILIALLMQFVDPPRQANEAYERGEYSEAESLYRQALRENPENYKLHFNLGNALANQGKFDEAIEAYESFKSRSQNAQERALADYNIGNIHAISEAWDKAIEQYRNSLRQNPDDDDAISNFEYAIRQMQQQEEQQQSQDGDQDDQDQEDGEDQQQQQKDGNDDQQQDQDQEQQQQSPEDEDEGGQDSPQSIPQDLNLDDMTPEEAEQLLNAIANNEKELIKDFLKDLTENNQRDERDW